MILIVDIHYLFVRMTVILRPGTLLTEKDETTSDMMACWELMTSVGGGGGISISFGSKTCYYYGNHL